MKTWIVARCPHCDLEQRQAVSGFRLFRCTTLQQRDFYTFTCLHCGHGALKSANAEVVCMLIGAGVTVQRFDLPMELGDPQRESGLPFSKDDLLDFLIDLAGWDGVLADERTD